MRLSMGEKGRKGAQTSCTDRSSSGRGKKRLGRGRRVRRKRASSYRKRLDKKENKLTCDEWKPMKRDKNDAGGWEIAGKGIYAWGEVGSRSLRKSSCVRKRKDRQSHPERDAQYSTRERGGRGPGCLQNKRRERAANHKSTPQFSVERWGRPRWLGRYALQVRRSDGQGREKGRQTKPKEIG